MTDRCPPIRDYALIGDCHGAALLSSEGNVDWCCLGRFDAEPILFRVLDPEKGGIWEITSPEAQTARMYLPETNILITVIRQQTGSVTVTDFMPVGRKKGSSPHDYVSLITPQQLVRKIEGASGHVALTIRFKPGGPSYGKEEPVLSVSHDGQKIQAEHGPELHANFSFELKDAVATSHIIVSAGEIRFLSLRNAPAEFLSSKDYSSLLHITQAFWKEWISYSWRSSAPSD